MNAPAQPSLNFVVRRDDLSQCRFEPGLDPGAADLDGGKALLKIVGFGFTANNITYGVVGAQLGYWKFFPQAGDWGQIPVWGIGEVVRSTVDAVSPGQRYFGYFPISNYLVVAPTVAGPGFVDGSAHRQGLPPVYNTYRLMSDATGFPRSEDDYTVLLRPLFMTSFMAEDFLADNDFFGATRVILSSASSKTAFGIAQLLARRGESRPEIVGLTSSGNVEFVQGLATYDRVLAYGDLGQLPVDQPSVYVDLAGNGELLQAVYDHLGEQLKFCSTIGLTHWQKMQPPTNLQGVRPTFFFAPIQIQKRLADWGQQGFHQNFIGAWRVFLRAVGGWLNVKAEAGPQAIERVYKNTLAGQITPANGHVLTLFS